MAAILAMTLKQFDWSSQNLQVDAYNFQEFEL